MVSPNGNQPIRQTGQEAQKKLRERLQARDDNTLPVVRKGETLQFGKWADSFLEHYSKPPFRTEKTHLANDRAIKHLRAAFQSQKLANVTAEEIEHAEYSGLVRDSCLLVQCDRAPRSAVATSNFRCGEEEVRFLG